MFTILLFALPSGMSTGMKTAWAAVFYICWGMRYTVSDVPYFSVVSVMSKKVSERDNVMSRGRLFTMLGSAQVTVIMPNLYRGLGSGVVFGSGDVSGQRFPMYHTPVKDAWMRFRMR